MHSFIHTYNIIVHNEFHDKNHMYHSHNAKITTFGFNIHAYSLSMNFPVTKKCYESFQNFKSLHVNQCSTDCDSVYSTTIDHWIQLSLEKREWDWLTHIVDSSLVPDSPRTRARMRKGAVHLELGTISASHADFSIPYDPQCQIINGVEIPRLQIFGKG